MPEGHTIHRIARDHGRLLRGKPIQVTSPQGRFASDAARIDGATLERLEAYGKHLFYWWSTGDIGHVHLGLFGKFQIHSGTGAPAPRGAVRMRLATDDVTIDLAGPTLCSVESIEHRDAVVSRLGPDPLRRDADPNRAIERMARSNKAMGALLLDQAVMAGIGNVYRAEVLFAHGIHPERPGKHCSPAELDGVWQTATKMLRAGVKANRIVTVDRRDLDLPRNRPIPRAEATYVYKRDRCLKCGTAIGVVEVANRTCYYCPSDQSH